MPTTTQFTIQVIKKVVGDGAAPSIESFSLRLPSSKEAWQLDRARVAAAAAGLQHLSITSVSWLPCEGFVAILVDPMNEAASIVVLAAMPDA